MTKISWVCISLTRISNGQTWERVRILKVGHLMEVNDKLRNEKS